MGGRRRVRWTGARDLGFFFHWESIAVAAGGIGLAALEVWAIPDDWPLEDFVRDYKLLLVILLAALVGLPPTIARGLDHLRARDDAGQVQVEIATALYGIEMRLMHFVSKLREVFAGHTTNTYQNHTLSDCQSYFSSRPGRHTDAGRQNIVEVNYYAVKRSGSSTSLVRTLFTGSGHANMRTTFSTARNASAEAKKLVKTITSGGSVFCRDVRDADSARKLHIENATERPYRTFLSVPVLRDKNSTAEDRVIGMISVNASEVDSIAESDAAILKVYAWVLAAAFEADLNGKKRRASMPTSEGAASLDTSTTGGDS